MKDSPYIAEEHLRGVRRDGTAVEIHVRIGRPYDTADGEWACPCDLQGLHDRLVDVRGASSFQALTLALALIRKLLSHFIHAGGHFTYHDDDLEVPIDMLFPGLSS